MKTIKTFDELWEEQGKAWQHTLALDLNLLREATHLEDGILIICCVTCSWYLDEEIFFIKNEDYEKWTEGEKDYLEHYYHLKF